MWHSKRTIRVGIAISALVLFAGNVGIAQGQCRPNELTKLPAREGRTYDFFGRAVAVSGQILVLGAYDDDDNGVRAGAAYVFRYDGARWVEEAKLLASDVEPYDSFGSSVAGSGDVVLVGAVDPGAAYVFRYDGSSWVEEAKLLAGAGTGVDLFGSSVAISGDVAVIGAPGDDENGIDSGAAYVFHFNGSTWGEAAKLLASDGGDSDGFGHEVALSGDIATIAAPGHANNVLAGFASEYLFRGLADCNSNGTLDICELDAGISPDENGNGLPDECELTAVSTKTHGDQGDFAVDVLTAGAVEPRTGGPTHVVIGFELEVEPDDGSLDPGDEVSVSSGTITNLSIDGTELHVEMQDAANNACLALSLHGLRLLPDSQPPFVMADADLHLGVVTGDVSGDGVVDFFDWMYIKAYWAQLTTSHNFRCDVHTDGVISAWEFASIRMNWLLQGNGLTCP